MDPEGSSRTKMGDLLRCRRRGLLRVSGRNPVGTYSPTFGALDGLMPLAAGGSGGLSLPEGSLGRTTGGGGVPTRTGIV